MGLPFFLAPVALAAQGVASAGTDGASGALPSPLPQQTLPSPPVPVTNPMSGPLAQWNQLRRSDTLPFADYANFLLVHRDWPGEAILKRNAERALRPDSEDPNNVVRFFNAFLPTTATGWLRYAEALLVIHRRPEAAEAARQAWITGPLSELDEARLIERFGPSLRLEEQDSRMDRLLWLRATGPAQRQIARTSDTRRPGFLLRLALLTKAVDAADQLAYASGAIREDPGFIADYMWWLRNTGQNNIARDILRQNMPLSRYPAAPDVWLQMLLISAKDAVQAEDWQEAYDIASRASSAYPPGTLVRNRPFAERDAYTDLTWLAGTAAMNRLGAPARAAEMFRLYAAAAQSPQTQARGLYWAGRAFTAAGQPTQARAAFESAAQYVDQFHGQLAAERLGRTIQLPPEVNSTSVTPGQRAQFANRSVVRALIALGESSSRSEQSLFVRSLAATIETDADHVLASELAARTGRPDLNVLVGRNARNVGLANYIRTAFPQVPVPNDQLGNWTIIHAISRQESQFDKEAVSRAGARGLMQLMPGTARDTARRLGMESIDPPLGDPMVNMALGASYFQRLLTSYSGSYVLAIAAYNAGPGNVNRWLRTIGDPRTNMDVLDWIEAIPFSETRNYVQRVLENAVIYDLLNPAPSVMRTNTPLSTYLGKSYPG